MATVITSILTFISTGMDYLMVLLILFHRYRTPRQRLAIICADYAGTGILVGLSLIAALILRRAPDQWLLGFLGLVPLAIGCHLLTHQESMATPANRVSANHLFLTVTFITVASCGADNLGVYIPYFATRTSPELVIVLVTFAVMVAVFCLLATIITHLPAVRALLDRYGTLLAGVIYLGLGILILGENGTALHLWHLIHH